MNFLGNCSKQQKVFHDFMHNEWKNNLIENNVVTNVCIISANKEHCYNIHFHTINALEVFLTFHFSIFRPLISAHLLQPKIQLNEHFSTNQNVWWRSFSTTITRFSDAKEYFYGPLCRDLVFAWISIFLFWQATKGKINGRLKSN